MSAYIVQHDCNRDNDHCRVIGPFVDDRAAYEFIDRYELEFPSDGGYAFAQVVSDGMAVSQTPAEMSADLDE